MIRTTDEKDFTKAMLLSMKARNDFDKAIKLNTFDDEAFSGRGETFHFVSTFGSESKNSFVNNALQDFNKAIELKNDYELANFARGNLLHRMNRSKDAISDYEKAIELDNRDEAMVRALIEEVKSMIK